MKKVDIHRDSLKEIKAQWDKKYQGEPLTILKKNIGGFEVRFNPLRARYMTSTQHAAIDTDVFCHKWDVIVKNEKIGEISLPHFSWILATNTSPIEQHHSLLICAEHQDQEMTAECMDDLHAFSLEYPELSVGFNGWRAGASQKHLHAQLFLSRLPITQWERDEKSGQISAYPGICFVLSTPQEAFTRIQELVQENIPYNVLFTNGLTYIIPRKNENDDKNIKRGFDSVFGKVPVLTQEDYDEATTDEVRNILATLMYQILSLNGQTLSL